MAYDSTIPIATEKLKDSQPKLLANFQAINTFVSVNHTDFNSPDQGKHKFIQFPDQAVNPDTNDTEIALFSRLTQNPVQAGVNTLALRSETNGSIVEFTVRNSAWARLPNGLLMKWAKFTIASASVGTTNRVDLLTWPTGAAIPVFPLAVNMVFVTQVNTTGGDISATVSVIDEPTTTNFNLQITTTATLGGWTTFDVYAYAFGG